MTQNVKNHPQISDKQIEETVHLMLIYVLLYNSFMDVNVLNKYSEGFLRFKSKYFCP